MLEGVSTVLTHTRDKEGFLASLAQIYYEILNDPERTQGKVVIQIGPGLGKYSKMIQCA